MVFDTGGSNIREENTIPEAIQLRTDGAYVIAVAVGDTNFLELRGIASEPHSDMVYSTESYTGLPTLVNKVSHALCDGNIIFRYSFIILIRNTNIKGFIGGSV